MWEKLRVIILILLVLIVTVTGSIIINSFVWKEKPETLKKIPDLTFSEGMTLRQFKETNGLPDPLVEKIFNITSEDDLARPLTDFNITQKKITTQITKMLILKAEENSKNWTRIRLKLILWLLFMILLFILTRLKLIKSRLRIILYMVAVTLFGIILGSDPSPMGTVKDAIVMYGMNKVFFPPRMIVLGVMLLLVVVANKFICSWGCQLGTLQDLLFRLNRKKDKQILPQFKIPFVVTNSIRIIFFGLLTTLALTIGFDIVNPINPFYIFNPLTLGISTLVFITVVMIASVFVYRPWCHFFCPFGLIGWLFEKISIFRIKVDYNTCINCNKCVNSCPSTVMGKILNRDGIIPDCFSCSSCIEACPTGAITFSAGKRQRPEKKK